MTHTLELVSAPPIAVARFDDESAMETLRQNQGAPIDMITGTLLTLTMLESIDEPIVNQNLQLVYALPQGPQEEHWLYTTRPHLDHGEHSLIATAGIPTEAFIGRYTLEVSDDDIGLTSLKHRGSGTFFGFLHASDEYKDQIWEQANDPACDLQHVTLTTGVVWMMKPTSLHRAPDVLDGEEYDHARMVLAAPVEHHEVAKDILNAARNRDDSLEPLPQINLETGLVE